MITTPLGAEDLSLCRPPVGSLGAHFTQVAVRIQTIDVSLNVHDIQPGDILLFSRRSARGWAKKHPVFTYQKRLFQDEVARWTHCGIFDENMCVWDAMPGLNIRVRPLREVLRESHCLKLVRPKIPPAVMSLRTTLLQFSNHQYRVMNIDTMGRLTARLAQAGKRSTGATSDTTVMCSLFVANVLRRSTRHGYLRQGLIAVPADFAVDLDFTDIRLDWHLAVP